MNGLQWWILAGLMVSGGILLIGWRLVPAQPDLADALARLAPTTARRTATDAGGEPADLTDRLGLWALRNLPGRLSGTTPHRDLAILGRSIQRFYGEKLLFAVILAASVPVLAAIYGMVLPVPPAFAAAGVALGAVLGWRLPTANLARAAAEARLEFNRALGSYVDLVALERSAGSSAPRQALENAAEIGDSWPFQRISDELARSRYSGETPWDAIGHLADELGLPALDDVADIMRLAGGLKEARSTTPSGPAAPRCAPRTAHGRTSQSQSALDPHDHSLHLDGHRVRGRPRHRRGPPAHRRLTHPNRKESSMSDSTEKLLWAIGIIALVGIVLGAMNGYIGGLLSTITGGG